MKGQRIVKRNFFRKTTSIVVTIELQIFFTFSTFRWNFRAALKNPPGQTRWTAIGSIVARSKIKRRSCLGAGRFPAESPEEENLAVFAKSRLRFSLFNRVPTSLHPSALDCTRLPSNHFSFSRNHEKRFKRADEEREVCMVYVRRKTKYL